MAHADDANGIGLYGLVAEFEDPNTLVAASRRAVQEGYRRLDAYTPFPIEELHEALGRIADEDRGQEQVPHHGLLRGRT